MKQETSEAVEENAPLSVLVCEHSGVQRQILGAPVHVLVCRQRSLAVRENGLGECAHRGIELCERHALTGSPMAAASVPVKVRAV